MRVSTLTAIVTIAVCLSAAGCGQKGNLYLPSQQKKKVPTTQAPAQPNTQAQPGTQAPPDSQSQ
jgi:predicted small lipoprotein YifL